MPPVDNYTYQLKYITRITTNNGDTNIKPTKNDNKIIKQYKNHQKKLLRLNKVPAQIYNNTIQYYSMML